MLMKKLTLKNRITTLLIIFSLLLIAIFTFIQLNNQLNNINRYNSYQANLSSLIVKNNLEAVLRQKNPSELPKYIQSNLEALAFTKIITDAVIFDTDGRIVASTEEDLIGSNIGFRELGKFQDLELLAQDNKWSLHEINRVKNRLNIYLPLKKSPQEPIALVVRISFSLGNIQEAITDVYRQVIISVILIILVNLLLGYLLSKTVIGPIKVLNEVTKIIASGDLSVRTAINTDDELAEVGSTFNYMAGELIKMKERAENANPLTKLPGNLVIFEEIEKKIRSGEKFLVIYCDLDNFKSYNDKYGIAQGDEAIKLTARILKESLKAKGNPGDFTGHEGGDDFILLTSPDKAENVSNYIIEEFSRCIKNLYSAEDLNQGYIISTGRDGSVKKFPIMTISMVGVTNENRLIRNYAEVTNIAAELKKKAKSIEASIFVIDKRRE
ncbi:GGDEF domain-containing protein [bacterium]|nr:MAG: GGDEF domain-containing protein [bacterium]